MTDHPFRTTIRLLALLLPLMIADRCVAQLPDPMQPQRATLSTALNVSALQPGKPALVAVVLDIKPGFHAQSRTPLDQSLIRFNVSIDENKLVRLKAPVYPAGEVHDYALLGKVNVYSGRVVVYVPLEVLDDAPVGDIQLSGNVEFQICDDQTCFQPESPTFTIQSKIVSSTTAVNLIRPELFAAYRAAATTQGASGANAAAVPSAAADPADEADGHSILWALGTALLAGLIFNIMPCVLPVLPLKALGFYEVSQHRRGQCILFGLVFSAGLVCVFTVLAVFVLVLKAFTWGEMFSRPAFVWSIVGLLILMALGLFGVFTTSLPQVLYRFSPRHDTFGGNFAWGAFTAILATPCTAPLLPPLLLWAASRPGYVGVPAIAMVGVGMALPYLLLSAFPELARNFPRTGPWPELFKQMLGFLVLAAAAVFAGGQLIEGANFWWATVPIVAIAAVFLVARTVQLANSALPVGIASTLAVVLFGITVGWTAKVTGALERSSTGTSSVAHKWASYTPQEFASARAAGKTVLIKFTANWCLTCQYIEGSVFRNEAVWETLERNDVVVMKVDLTRPNPDGTAILKTLNPAGGIPLTAIYSPRLDRPIVLASVYSSSELLDALAKTGIKPSGEVADASR